MKKITSIFRYVFMLATVLFMFSCVHDDKYDTPDTEGFNCGQLTPTLTIQQVKEKYTDNNNKVYTFPGDSKDVVEAYVSSSDDSGNIYKYIYVQDAPSNPTQGFIISVNTINNYSRYPQGSKIFIKLAGLSVGKYYGVLQLGVKAAEGSSASAEIERIPEQNVYSSILRSCEAKEIIVPKIMKLSEMVSANDKYLGCLIQVDDVEFTQASLCNIYAPGGSTVDRTIGEGRNAANTSYNRTAVVRNSGFASFASKKVPAGKGKFVGIFSKYNSTYQMYIVRDTDLDMNTFPRLDGITTFSCDFSDAGLTRKTIAEVKALYTSGNYTQITGDYYVKAQITANDETGNLYKYIYVEDETGGIKININKVRMYQETRFGVGRMIYIKLKDIYVGKYANEFQLGQPYNGSIGQLDEVKIFKTFYDAGETKPVIAAERTISELTTADVGKWVKIKDVQFIDSDLGKSYAENNATTNRTLEDCSGKRIILRTSNYATFAEEILDSGKGDVYGILSLFYDTYQLWVPYQYNADFDDPRCGN